MSLTARDIMTANPVTVTPETSISEASKILVERGFNGVPVVDAKGMIKGILCQSDLVMQHKRFQIPSFFTLFDGFIPLQIPSKFEERLEKMAAVNVEQAMTPNPIVVAPETPIENLAALMVDDNFHTLPVVEDGRLIGIVGKEDMLKTMVK